MSCLSTTDGCAPVARVVRGLDHPFTDGVDHRDLYRRPDALVGTLQQRREDPAVGIHPGRDVCDRDTDFAGHLRRAGSGYKSGLALDEEVVSLPLRIRPVW